MLLEKIFHIHQPLDETRSRLSTLSSYRRQLDGVERAMTDSEGVMHLQCETGLGYVVFADLMVMTNGEASDRVLFRSLRGNIEVAGIVEFFEINDALTEVVLTIDYQLKSPFGRIADALGAVIDRFLNAQLRCVEAHFEGIGSFATHAGEPVHRMRFADSAA